MSAVSKESEDEAEAAGTSSMMESTMMEGEEYYNPDPTVAWSEKVAGGEQLCRICAGANEYLIPIFSGEGLEHQLGMKIEKHLPIQVLEQDKLPVQVCYQCASTLIAWHDLVVGCVEAEKKLQQLYQQENAEEEEEEDDFGDDDRTELFNDPVDSEMAEDPLEPSTSTSTATRSTRSPRKKTVTRAKPKLKMTLVKTPAALPKSPPKLLQPKEEQVEADPATERWQQTSTNSLVCLVCGETFIRECYLRAHVERFHSFDSTSHEDLVQDVHCPLDTANMDEVQHNQDLGMWVVSPKCSEVLPCIVCGKSFQNESTLQNHIILEHSHYFQNDETVNNLNNCEKVVNILSQIPKVERESERGHKDLHGVVYTSNTKSQIPKVECESERGHKDLHGVVYTSRKLNPRHPRLYQCNVCGNSFTRKYDMIKHQKQQHTEGEKLPSSDRKLESKALIAGKRTNRKLNPKNPRDYGCDVCDKLFTRFYDMEQHKLRMHSVDSDDAIVRNRKLNPKHPRLYQCDICSNSFTRNYDMLKHRKLHHSAVPTLLTNADFALLNLADLDVEISVDPAYGDAPLRAVKRRVNRRYNEDELERMEKARVVVDGKTFYRCDVCGNHLGSKYNFVSHLLVHTGEKPFTCHVCGKQFRVCGQLQRHVSDVHDKVKKYGCEVCGRTFATINTRNEHLHTHSQERSFVCHLCGRAFRSNGTLRVHQMLHSDVFPHQCPYCDKRFKMRQRYENHLRVHTGERPFACVVCEKRFKTKSEVRNHMLTHTNTEKFNCEACMKSYSQKKYLKNHLRLSHGVRGVVYRVRS